MAKKAEFLVIDGCVQDGRVVVVKGEPYSPPNKEIEESLLAEGRIAPLKDPRARDLLSQQPDVADESDDRGGE
ncbi:hypothetical protein [Pseudomonas sp. efr-133-TYG-5]|uniref:hypothetical protein n=1 Tax=Pseudomonas sp. efr-133-TYG-5 TaxID=3040310 RepID=UPI00255457D6|nr:hypothetical protein [Pseudomonas sp. efr-133-TYG-5]